MSTYTAAIRWTRTGPGDFAKGQYSRARMGVFDGAHDNDIVIWSTSHYHLM